MTFPSLTAVTRTAGRLQSLTLAVLPHGGQRSARRNAWSAMSADAAQARARREAEAAIETAIAVIPAARTHVDLSSVASR